MTYVALSADLTHLSSTDIKELVEDAAALDIDVVDLSPRWPVNPAVVTVFSAALGAVLTRLGPRPEADRTRLLWDLLRRPLESRPGATAVYDKDNAFTFVFEAPTPRPD